MRKTAWYGLLAVLCLMGFSAVAQEVKPPAEPAKDVKPGEPEDPSDRAAQRLRKPIKASFKNVSLTDALAQLAEACDVDIVAEWHSIEEKEIASKDMQITLNLRHTLPGEAVLQLVLRVSGGKLRYDVEHGVVIVSAQPEQQPESERPATEMRIIDVSGLIKKGDGAPPVEDQVKRLMAIIMDVVQPESWRDKGGSVGSMATWGTKLIVRQTEAAQTEIAKMMLELKD